MASLEERVARLEGRVEEQAAFAADVRVSLAALQRAIDALGSDLREEMNGLRDGLREEMNDLRDGLRAEMDRRFDRMDRHFGWLVGILVTSFLATIGVITGAFWTLLQTLRA